MDKKIPFSPVVMLIDAPYINKVGLNLAEFFSTRMNRAFPEADLAVLLEYMAVDAGISTAGNEIEVIFIYERTAWRMPFCRPSDIPNGINGKAFQSKLGEFSLYAYQTSDMAERADLFMEALQLADASDDVQQIIILPDEDDYGQRAADYLDTMKKSGRVFFGMKPQGSERSFRTETIGFPLLKAYGIDPAEL